MTEAIEAIQIPRRAADQVAALITQYQAAEAALRSHVQLLAGALDVPDGWQLDTQRMVFAPPPQPAEPGEEPA